MFIISNDYAFVLFIYSKNQDESLVNMHPFIILEWLF